MKIKIFIAIASSAIAISGCAVSGGDTAFLDATPMGDHADQASKSFPSIGSAFPLKIANRDLLDKRVRDAIDPYFQTNGDYPEIYISSQYGFDPATKHGYDDDYMAQEYHSIWSSNIIFKDWATSDLIFELGAKCDVRGTSKYADFLPASGGLADAIVPLCLHNLSVDIVTKLQSRRSEIDSQSEKYKAWKKNQ